jgi:predicted nucleic-acid-binding protein
MVAIDTNVIVRLLTNDDPAQVARARALLERETVWLGLAALLESEWVLRAVYRLDRRVIGEALTRFISLPMVVVEDDARARRILDLYRHGLDFADATHLMAAKTHASAFVSFDAALARHAAACGAKPPVVAP